MSEFALFVKGLPLDEGVQALLKHTLAQCSSRFAKPYFDFMYAAPTWIALLFGDQFSLGLAFDAFQLAL